MTRVLISPQTKPGQTTGGIARVVEAQNRWLGQYDIEIVDRPEYADVLALHATNWLSPVREETKVVSHCHGLYWAGYDWHSKWYGAVNHQVIEAMRQADAVTAPSEWVAQSIRRGSQLSNIRVIGHGVDLEDWPTDNKSQGYVYWDKSRVDPICDPRPVNVLAAALPSVQFKSTFGDQARNVDIVGELSYQNNKQLMQGAGLYLATARETFGISVLEAMACGVPVVGWDWAGQAEIMAGSALQHLLVAPGDYDGLTRVIKVALENRDKLSLEARDLVEKKYQWKNVIRDYAELYDDLMKEPGGPKVSVVMPSYNLKQYLGAAIESVLAQDYQDYELIVVDDCSSDGSYEIAKNLADNNPRITVLRTPYNLYLAGALNYGIERASGKYILPLDADNMLAPGTLRTLTEQLDQNRWLDIAYGKVKFVVEDGSPDTSVSGDGISGWPPRDFNYDAQMAHRNQIPSTSMYRKTIWSRVGGYRSRCRTAEDADFWCRATSFGATARRVTDAVTLIYRNRQDSMSHVEKDWPWEVWYSWASKPELTPYIASVHRDNIPVPIFEPKVSIIVPVGSGHERQGLQDALDSVASQTYQDWEAIVVNDTGEDLPWAPSWARVIATPNRASGAGLARNLGLKEVSKTSQYVVFLDADDYLDPTFLAKTLKVMYSAGPNSYVYTDFWKPEKEQTVEIDAWSCQDQLQSLKHPITALYPRRACEGGFDQGRIVGEDWDFVLSVLAAGYCGVGIREPLVYYRQTSGSNRKGLLENITEIRRQLKEKWEAKLMGCGCSSQVIQQPVQDAQMSVQPNSELVLMQFVQPDVPTRSWTGPVTGHSYRFGSEVGHNVGYVHRADAEQLSQRPEFQLVDPGTGGVASFELVGG